MCIFPKIEFEVDQILDNFVIIIERIEIKDVELWHRPISYYVFTKRNISVIVSVGVFLRQLVLNNIEVLPFN